MGSQQAGRGGLFLALVSAATFGTAGAFASSLLAAGWSAGGAVLVRISLAALVLTLPAVVQLRGRWHLLRHRAAQVGAYGVVAVAGAQVCYFNAIARLDVGIALLLEYLGTFLVVGWLWLRNGQRPHRLTLIGAAVAAVGLAMVLNVSGAGRLDAIGVLWALGAAAGLATYFVIAGDQDEALPPLVMAWAGLVVGAGVLAGLGATGALAVRTPATDVVVLGRPVSWLLPALGLSLVAAVVAYVAGMAATRRLGARLASFVGLTEVLFAVLFAWLLLGQLPRAIQGVGAVVVLAGVALVRADELRSGGPGQPTEPIEITELIEPTESTERIEPTERIELIEPIEPDGLGYATARG